MAETLEIVSETLESSGTAPHLEAIISALQVLDRLLERAVAEARGANGTDASEFRGLYVSDRDADQLLTGEPCSSRFFAIAGKPGDRPSELKGDAGRLLWLMRVFALSEFDIDLLIMALAPELDLRYERLYAYLQDDITRKRPTVDLALNLLCVSPQEKLERRAHFAANSPLIRHRLLHLYSDINQRQSPLLAQYIKADDQIIRFLLGEQSLETRLQSFCQLIYPGSPEDSQIKAELDDSLLSLATRAWSERQPLRLFFHGPKGAGKREAAQWLGAKIAAPILIADLNQAVASELDFDLLIELLMREAWFHDAILYIENLDPLRADNRSVEFEQLMLALFESAGVVILSDVKSWVPAHRNPLGMIYVPFSLPDFAQRRDCWASNLSAFQAKAGDDCLDALAGHFRLSQSQIAEAVVTARNMALLRDAQHQDLTSSSAWEGQPTAVELFAAARAQSGHELTTLARKITPVATWSDIVLPADALAQLREICQRVEHRHQVFGDWGFNRKLSVGKGINALFTGPSGSGKTMSAEILANEIGLDLFKIDLSGIVSKYIGETEKNLDRIFTAAENANAILFFDEADALFGQRSEVKDSHDRYANLEISYLLQKMEEYEGIAILATNLLKNLDEAFVRRLAFTIHFPFPNEASRRSIWQGMWPEQMPLADDVDMDMLARQFKLSGGNIKNIALAAAFLAAEARSPITLSHVLHAVRREYQKMGKALTDSELNPAQLSVGKA